MATKFLKLTKAAVATQVNFFSYERSLEIETLKEKVVIIFKTHKNVIKEKLFFFLKKKMAFESYSWPIVKHIFNLHLRELCSLQCYLCI